ncbi:MAG: NAD(+) kinase [Candidatus Cloacimonas sp. 4484_275]|nr:MAG: NAD(+) kinase [Candidatus Cloacimonas sp. 4484_275]
MKNFGIFFNPNYQDKKAIFNLLKQLYENKNLRFFKSEEQREVLPDFIRCLKKEKKVKLDCIFVFGGDGTILKALNFSLKTKAPILGINLGKLGFLSESSLKELEKSIDDLKKNKFKVQARMLLKVILRRNKKVIFSSLALNDAVIYKGEAPKLIDVKISSNRRFVVETRCDGVIAATPTGSTAYSLSAGGPILSPIMDAIVVAPLNPHILSVRPMVFSSDDNIGFTIMNADHKILLQLDGQNRFELHKGDKILVTAASQKVDFIKLSNRTFYQILRKKLHMGKK